MKNLYTIAHLAALTLTAGGMMNAASANASDFTSGAIIINENRTEQPTRRSTTSTSPQAHGATAFTPRPTAARL